MASVGVLGGTFNPPHIGHLACAEAALDGLGLDRLLLMPVFRPPHKQVDGEPGPEHRAAMCEAAATGDQRLEVSRLEIERGGASFTLDTLRALLEADPHAQLTFVAGGDMAASLPEWHEPEDVLRLARFAVAQREGASRAEVSAAVAGLAGAERLEFFEMPAVDVSSTMVRRALLEGRAVRDLLPDAVAAYIEEHGLYREALSS